VRLAGEDSDGYVRREGLVWLEGEQSKRVVVTVLEPTGMCRLMMRHPFPVQSSRNGPGRKMHLCPEDGVESVGLEHRPIQTEAL
jgi:hypothetical protein